MRSWKWASRRTSSTWVIWLRMANARTPNDCVPSAWQPRHGESPGSRHRPQVRRCHSSLPSTQHWVVPEASEATRASACPSRRNGHRRGWPRPPQRRTAHTGPSSASRGASSTSARALAPMQPVAWTSARVRECDRWIRSFNDWRELPCVCGCGRDTRRESAFRPCHRRPRHRDDRSQPPKLAPCPAPVRRRGCGSARAPGAHVPPVEAEECPRECRSHPFEYVTGFSTVDITPSTAGSAPSPRSDRVRPRLHIMARGDPDRRLRGLDRKTYRASADWSVVFIRTRDEVARGRRRPSGSRRIRGSASKPR